MAPDAARFVVPIDRMAVTTAGRPVGIADTEKAMAVRNSTSNGVLRHRPMRDRDEQRDAGDDEDLVRQRVELTGQRRDLLLGVLEHPADVSDLGLHAGRRDEE